MNNKDDDPKIDEVDQRNEGGRHSFLKSITLVATVVSLTTLFVVANPTSGGPRIVILALVLIFALLFQLAWGAIQLFTSLKGGSTAIRHPLLLSQLLAMSGIFLIGLLSLNQLSITDVLLTIIMVTVIYLYIIRRF